MINFGRIVCFIDNHIILCGASSLTLPTLPEAIIFTPKFTESVAKKRTGHLYKKVKFDALKTGMSIACSLCSSERVNSANLNRLKK